MPRELIPGKTQVRLRASCGYVVVTFHAPYQHYHLQLSVLLVLVCHVVVTTVAAIIIEQVVARVCYYIYALRFITTIAVIVTIMWSSRFTRYTRITTCSCPCYLFLSGMLL